MQKRKDEAQHLLRVIRDVLTEYHKPSEREVKILETIIQMESGNVYNIWKSSGLKHYPTALRVVKKLEQKKMAVMLSENGDRGEKIYSPTLLGILTYFSLKEDAAKLIETISGKSQSFRDMLNANLIPDSEVLLWIASYARQIMYDLKDRREQNINDIVRNNLSSHIGEDLFEIEKQDHKNELIHFAKLEWVKELILEEMEDIIREDTERIKRLHAFKKTLISK
jgi:hypothetical protein